MRFVTHKNIDKDKWDVLVAEFGQDCLYLKTWYLDAACPIWNAIVWGDYEAIMPLPTKNWWIIKKVYQPYFVQQTGIVHKPYLQLNNLLDDFLKSDLHKFYFSFRTQFSSQSIIDETILSNKKWKFEHKKNFVLDLQNSYSILSSNFNDNRKRNLKKGIAAGWHVEQSTDLNAAIKMYKENQAPKQKGLANEVYEVLIRIFDAAVKNNSGELLACKNSKNETISFAFFIHTSLKKYYIFGSMNSDGRKHSAISLLFNEVIKSQSEKNLKLDFEGGNLESIGQFFASFGAQEEEYLSIWK
jgi:hypothetical protein